MAVGYGASHAALRRTGSASSPGHSQSTDVMPENPDVEAAGTKDGTLCLDPNIRKNPEESKRRAARSDGNPPEKTHKNKAVPHSRRTALNKKTIVFYGMPCRAVTFAIAAKVTPRLPLIKRG